MDVDTQVRNGTASIRLDGKFVFAHHRVFRKAIEDQLHSKCSALEIDLAKVDALDSSGLGMLLLAHESATKAGKTIALRNCSGGVKDILELAYFKKLFLIQ